MSMKQPDLQSVQSSNLESIGFCPDTNCIWVKFHNGGCYRYEDCNRELFNQLMESESKGQFVHRNLKGRKFQKVG